MRKSLLFILLSVLGTRLFAQENQFLGKADFLAAIKEYNPIVLEQADQSAHYAAVLEEIAAAYSRANTEENQYELIALAKNFNNSLYLLQLQQKYEQGLLYQQVSGTDLPALDKQVQEQLAEMIGDVFANTIDVRKMQLRNYQNQLKAIRKDKTLSAQEKEKALANKKNSIKNMKNTIKQLKKTRKQTIENAAQIQMEELRSSAQRAVSAVQG